MTPTDQAKILALLDKIDPEKCGPQTMKEHAGDVRRLLEREGFEAKTVGPDTLDAFRESIDALNDKVDALSDKFDRLGGQLAAIEAALAEGPKGRSAK